MKKLFAMLLAVMMVLSLATVAFAEEEIKELDPIGTITLTNPSEDYTYAVYRMLILETYSTAGSGAYSYRVHPDWKEFFTTGAGAEYVNIDAQGYVTAKEDFDESNAPAFAAAAMEYVIKKGIDPVQSSDPELPGEFVITSTETGTKGVFSNLPMGYYLVDSTAGALCGLTTTNPNAVVNSKNTIPSIDKTVKEDSTGTFGGENTADIGQTVEFLTIITVAHGAQDYILHDFMSAGLTYIGVTSITLNGTEIDNPGNSIYEVVEADPTCTAKGHDGTGCTFHIVFEPTWVKSLSANDKIIVHYTAMLNRNAIVAGDGNVNGTKLQFGDTTEGHYTTEDTTTTKTFSFDIVKTDSQNTMLNGAIFEIKDGKGNVIKVVPLFDYDGNPVNDERGNQKYRRARDDEPGEQIVVSGKVTVVGFDNGEYFLHEIEPPAGYNKLAAPHKFTITNANLDSIFVDDIYSAGSGVHVVNKTGNMLPETGAEGTIAFITFGVVVMMATGVLLITRKRMSMIVD